MKTPDEIESANLCDLSTEEIAHVSLGLGHSFGAVLTGTAGAAVMYLRPEYTGLIALDAKTIRVSDLWKTAESISQGVTDRAPAAAVVSRCATGCPRNPAKCADCQP